MKKFFSLLLLAAVFAACANSLTLKIVPGRTDYTFTLKKSGTYWVISHSKSLIPVGEQHFADMRLGDGPKMNRRLLPYNRTEATARLERFQLQGGKKYALSFKYDTKRTVVSKIQFVPERPYPVLKAARTYQPKLIPPARHPRLFVNPDFLAQLKKKVDQGDSRPTWEKVEKMAVTPYDFKIVPGEETGYDAKLLDAVKSKAFYYLLKEDKKIGRESADLILTYVQRAALGNGQDICRKVGEIIFAASLVYDWCYPLLSLEEKALLRKRMLFYAAELEAGWPPFRQYASAGHGNEAQFNRDLFSMALAIYDEDPLPYRYVAYQMFEIWQPLKALTYKSGRHSQGSSYGQYRAQFDYLAALQIYRNFGIYVLPEEAKDFPLYFYYMRLPDGCFLIEGDDNWKIIRPQYIPINALLLNCLMALYPNPDYKMELIRGKKLMKPIDPILFLLSNDPDLKPRDLRAKLPLSRLFKDPLPGLSVRTGWDFTPDSDDLVLTMNGGNRQLRNHQHGDAGAFQLFYREYLITDLGQYRYYGILFDRLLNKTSLLHSTMRFYDPATKKPVWKVNWPWRNSGSQKNSDDHPPLTLKSFLTEKRFYCGETPRMGFGPSAQKPVYNFMESSLAPAYLGGVKSFNRTFVFWNQNNKNRPGTLLILDRFQKSNDKVTPIFQLTTFTKPVWKNGVMTLKAQAKTGKSGCVTVKPLLPADPQVQILTGDAFRTINGEKIPARYPDRREAKGSRIEVTGKGDIYLHALQVHDGELKPRPVSFTREGKRLNVLLQDEKTDYLTSLGEVDKVTAKAFSIKVKKAKTQVLILDLAPGKWQAVCGGKKLTFDVTKDKGSVYSVLNAGTWQLKPVKK